MTTFYVVLAFLVTFVVLACIAAVLVACGWLTIAARKPARKTPPKEKP